MKQDEFIKIQQNLTHIIMEYEFLQRKGNVIGNSYLLEFYELLEQQKYLEYENKYLTQALMMKAEEKPISEIEEFLNSSKQEFNGIMNFFYKQYATAKELAQRMEHYNAKDIESLDSTFQTYCKLYHPMIKGKVTDGERNLYDILIHLYRLGNVEGFTSFLEENKSMLSPVSFQEEEYASVAKIYEQSIQELSLTIKKQKESFPFNREDLFQDPTSITQEHIKLRESNYNLREMNRSLQKDFQLHFTSTFEL